MKQGESFLFFSFNQLLIAFYRAHIACWCAESNCLFKIINDHELGTLMKMGHPGTTLPSCFTASHDVKLSFKTAKAQIDQILKVGFLVCQICETNKAISRIHQNISSLQPIPGCCPISVQLRHGWSTFTMKATC